MLKKKKSRTIIYMRNHGFAQSQEHTRIPPPPSETGVQPSSFSNDLQSVASVPPDKHAAFWERLRSFSNDAFPQ